MASQSAAIAKAAKTRIVAARTDGTLSIPAEAKIRVSSRDGIDVNLEGVPTEWLLVDGQISPAAQAAGAVIAGIVREERDKAGNGWQWCMIFADGASIGSVPRSGWQPGQD